MTRLVNEWCSNKQERKEDRIRLIQENLESTKETLKKRFSFTKNSKQDKGSFSTIFSSNLS